MIRKKYDRTQIRHECLMLAIWQLMLSDYDDKPNCVIQFEKKCKKYEKRKGLKKSLSAAVTYMSECEGYIEEDEAEVDTLINKVLDLHDAMRMSPFQDKSLIDSFYPDKLQGVKDTKIL